jgi:hypothetical protein
MQRYFVILSFAGLIACGSGSSEGNADASSGDARFDGMGASDGPTSADAAPADAGGTLDATDMEAASHDGGDAAPTDAGTDAPGAGDASAAMHPLRPLAANPHWLANPHWFDDGTGKAVVLAGSHTWNALQDTDMSAAPAAADFAALVAFLKAHGHNATILWRKDLPTYCNWGAGGTWHMAPFPWPRTGPGAASDGQPKFDLHQFDTAYFDRLRARALSLRDAGVYAIVELFDGLGIHYNRCGTTSPTGDGYPFTGVNNVNGIDDGYTGGASGTGSMTMSAPNAITAVQDAYVKKVVDTLNDLPNVLWEISEEAPDDSTWWQGHVISVLRSYEAGKPLQHAIGYPTLDVGGASDATLFDSNADWVAPKEKIAPTSACGSGAPACKVSINDSDHSYFGLWNDSTQINRNFVWENFMNGSGILFMDPYVIDWPGGGRNPCATPTQGVCSAPATRYDNLRDNLGYVVTLAAAAIDLAKLTPQPQLASTGFALANAAATGTEYIVYAPSGGSFTVDLSATTRPLAVRWLDPTTGATQTAPDVTGGSSKQVFMAPFVSDAVLHAFDAMGR